MPEASASPLDVADLRARVQQALDAFLAGQVAGLADIGDDLAPAAEAITALLAGGKRLRPAFAYWGWRAAGGADGEAIVRAASSLELVQACALIHDDVMDGSDTRRGLPSVHRRFAELHADAGWLGSADWFGVGAAILVGDLCLAWADDLLLDSGLPADALVAAKPYFDRMRTEVMAGQLLDLQEQARGGGSEARALRVARYKSAKYTVERPLHLGGALAGADATLMAAFTGYGLPLGEAFQLRDDVLGVFGDPGVTGKPAGDDLREGKRTVLVAAAAERASATQAEVLQRHLGDRALDAAGVAALQQVIVDTGALVHVEQLVERLTAEALAALAPVQGEARVVLERLAVAATTRHR